MSGVVSQREHYLVVHWQITIYLRYNHKMETEKRLIFAVLVLGVISFVSFYALLTRAPKIERSGEEIFRGFCRSCHTSRIIKAPNIGDSQAWKARIDQGNDKLLEHVINGYRGMPERGTCSNCSVDELRETIKYIVSKSREEK